MFRLVIVLQRIESVMWPQGFSILSIFLSLLVPLLSPGPATLAIPAPSLDQQWPQFLHQPFESTLETPNHKNKMTAHKRWCVLCLFKNTFLPLPRTFTANLIAKYKKHFLRILLGKFTVLGGTENGGECIRHSADKEHLLSAKPLTLMNSWTAGFSSQG